jgi:hypothetical protein
MQSLRLTRQYSLAERDPYPIQFFYAASPNKPGKRSRLRCSVSVHGINSITYTGVEGNTD